ncbi:DNA polymerase Y family protein [Thermodesulfovibrio yellowstonii]|uniref:DNA polymerase IV n=1 Tax=Thermodesulfovibrio yellowstonii TaxID=28262 RepID=A0A9W6GIA7_9BACT|nr:DNA polymerase IV [Thermodesulfovibrio islandicus]GLI54480.1 DNA polymerase IV [Thermodesulfovibrio islandicus]
MTEQPLIIQSWSKAILHLDADGFFASVEQATNPVLKGKPVVVGAERGMATAVSYEAKARGITRGMLVHEIKRLCPDAVLVESDYEKYSLFSVKMFEIIRRFSSQVEEYSIDEAFVDLTGLRRVYRCSYGEIGMRIKETIKRELGITVSVGVSLTKVLAKVASKNRKPDGLTVIPGKDVHLYLKELPIEKIWGIGPNTASYCEKLGIRTALDFARKNENFIKRYFTKPHQEIWHELNGRSVYPVVTEPKRTYKSISKVKTFNPTSDRNVVYGHLIENIDNAFFKARRYGLSTNRVIVFIKRQDYRDIACEIVLTEYTSYPEILFPSVRDAFLSLYKEGVRYRQTGVILLGLSAVRQGSLFEASTRVEKIEKLYNVIDYLKVKFGRDILVHAPVLCRNERDGRKQKIGIPVLNIEV